MSVFQTKPSKRLRAIGAFALLLWLPLVSHAQYSELFATAEKGYLLNCANDFSGVNWTLTSWDPGGSCRIMPPDATTDLRDPNDYFKTTATAGGVLECIDLDQEVCWESPLMNISAAGTVSLSVGLTWAGFDIDVAAGGCLGDYIKVMYSVNGGAYTMVPNAVGGNSCATVAYLFSGPPGPFTSSTTVTQGGISGTNLKIRVCVSTNANAEVVTIDNVSVPQAGVTLNCSQPILSTTVKNIVCNGPNSGSIDLSVSGGTSPYTYDWSNNGPQTPDTDPQDLTGLAIGTYTVTVTDAANCSQTTTATIINAPIVQSPVTFPAACGSADGAIDLSVSGGNAGYTYDWSNNGSQNPDTDPQDLSGLATGTYTVTVTDSSTPGCASSAGYSVGAIVNGPYNETFSTPNKGYLINQANNFLGMRWTMSPWTSDEPATGIGRDNGDYFQTNASGKLECVDTDQNLCWISPELNISSSGTVQFSVDLAWTGFDDEDYISVQHSINGGAFVTMTNAFGGGAGTIQYASPSVDQNGSLTVTKTGLSGNKIQIKICVLTNSQPDVAIIDSVSIPQTVSYCFFPIISTAPTNVTCVGGNNGNIQVTASSGTPGYNVSWSGPSSGNPAGTEIASAGGTYNIASLTAGTYTVTITDAAGLTATAFATLTTLNPLENAAFGYAKSGYCQAGTDPAPVIYGNAGGMFSAPPQVSINASTGVIDVSASTAGGPYNVTYTTSGPCPVSTNFALSIVNCAPGATLTDAIIIDNGAAGKADPGDRIRLTATISNGQTADYSGMQLGLNNDPKVTFVAASFKSTPLAIDDAYTATLNVQLSVPLGSGVLANDFDDNIPGLSVTGFSATSTQGGTVSVSANGSFTYNPPNGFTGNDTFTYTITDSDAQTNTGTVRIRVQ